MTEDVMAPDAAYAPGALPDPILRVGRHVFWYFERGVATRHDAYTRVHDGVCPPSCRPLPWAPAADPNKPAVDAWSVQLRRGRATLRSRAEFAPPEPAEPRPPAPPVIPSLPENVAPVLPMSGLAPIAGDPYQ